jgi:penicillin-binding protein 2
MFLGFLIVFTGVLLLRAAQVQVVQKAHWREEAVRKVARQITTPTTRGPILDIKGRELAVDQPCVDACVDFRVITAEPDAAWLADRATRRIAANRRDEFRRADPSRRRQIQKEEEAVIRRQIQSMWELLARESGQTLAQINATCQKIEASVRLRRRSQWINNYEKAMSRHDAKDEPSWYTAFLLGEDSDAPELDEFDQEIEEQRSPHVVLPAIDTALQNLLALHADELPGLTLRPGTHRVYPFGEIGCHVIGALSRVTRDDLVEDLKRKTPELRRYNYTDSKGSSGLEALAEPSLRGTRGLAMIGTDGTAGNVVPAVAGQPVRCTIDIELQTDIQELLRHTPIPWEESGQSGVDIVDMHAAAVVIDVASGELRALVSNPGFDLNHLDQLYEEMIRDPYNSALLNRATQSQLEPGSTVKPVVGIGAITQGLIDVNTGIECTGYLIIGKTRYGRSGRCWTASKFAKSYPALVAHHQIPTGHEHRGHDNNPDGSLTFSDALQRSCNVYFETVADKLQAQGLSYWMDRFGLGRPTGVGIAEACGTLPNEYTGARSEFNTWTAGIGQGSVHATPIQMANVAATIARKGIWMRPRLFRDDVKTQPYHPRKPGPEWDNIPDRVDLMLNPDAVEAARQGMIRVVNDDGGTGKEARRSDMIVAGKTGTAQAAPFLKRVIDPDTGKQLRDDGGKLMWEPVQSSMHGRENTSAPWYRGFDADGTNLKHSWFIGFAPADNPQVALAVMVEYGGGGSSAAGSIANKILDSLLQHRYLNRGQP